MTVQHSRQIPALHCQRSQSLLKSFGSGERSELPTALASLFGSPDHALKIIKGVEMTPTDIITVIILLLGGTFIAGTIIHLISEEIEYRRWWRKVKDDTRKD